jgi:hypothetical protein
MLHLEETSPYFQQVLLQVGSCLLPQQGDQLVTCKRNHFAELLISENQILLHHEQQL